MTSTFTSAQRSGTVIDIDGADVVIKSNDDAEFRVQRTALALFSPVFADILSLPQPEGSHYSLPVVPVSENCELVLTFVRYVASLCKSSECVVVTKHDTNSSVSATDFTSPACLWLDWRMFSKYWTNMAWLEFLSRSPTS